MADLDRNTGHLFWLAVLYVLASPVFALRGVAALISKLRRDAVVDSGYLRCPWCHHGNRLDLYVRCPKCGFTEPRSLALPCSECGATVDWIYCAKCNASVRLP